MPNFGTHSNFDTNCEHNSKYTSMMAATTLHKNIISPEICRHQPSSPTATSCYPVTQTLPSTFVAVGMARAVAVAVVVGGGMAVVNHPINK
jgi:hypothetical protein